MNDKDNLNLKHGEFDDAETRRVSFSKSTDFKDDQEERDSKLLAV